MLTACDQQQDVANNLDLAVRPPARTSAADCAFSQCVTAATAAATAQEQLALLRGIERQVQASGGCSPALPLSGSICSSGSCSLLC